MKVPYASQGKKSYRQNVLARYLIGQGIPGVRWDHIPARFTGISGYSIGMRSLKDNWDREKGIHNRLNRLGPHPILMVTSTTYGDDIDQTIVAMRLEDFAPMFTHWVMSDPERYLTRKEQD